MIPGQHKFLGFLIDEQGRSLYEDTSGAIPVLKRQSVPRKLKYLPDGWMDTEIKYSRNMKFMGMDRMYSNQYKFVKDGAFILRSLLYDSRGTESKVFFILLRWNPDTGIHELFFRAEVDLSNAVNDPLTGVTANLIEGGATKMIKANEGVVNEYQCNENNPDAVELQLDGVLLRATYNYSFPETNIGGFQSSGSIIIPFTFLNFEGDSVGIIPGSPSWEDVGSTPDPSNYFFKTLNPINVSVVGTMNFRNVLPKFAGTDVLEMIVYLQVIHTSGPDTLIELFNENPVPLNAVRTIDINQNISLLAGDRLYFSAFLRAPGYDTFLESIELRETNVTLTFNSQNEASRTWCISAYNLWKQIIDKITNGRFKGDSTLLAGKENLLVTCGDSLRGIDTALLKTSLNQFADLSFMKILRGSVCIDYTTNTVRFESKEYVFDNSNMITDLGEVSDLDISIAKEFIFGSINVGYTGKDSTDNLGKQNFNDKKVFGNPVTRTSAVLDLLSTYRADIFTIEQIRSDYFSKDQTATEKDNDVFIINAKKADGILQPYRPAFSSITGGTNTSTWYNIDELTPHRILETNGSFISIGLWAQMLEKITFQSAERNKDLVTILNGITIGESFDIRVNNLNAPFAFPFYFKFKTKVPYNLISLLQAGNGYIKFSYNGTTLYGFPMELTQLPVYDEAQEWKLLCSSRCNPADLVLLNDVITIGGNGMISHKNPLKLVPLNATFSAQFHFRHMDADWHKNRIGRYSQKQLFAQKAQTNDNTPLQFITNGSSMNDVKIYNCKGKVVDTITPTSVSHPAIILPFQLWYVVIDWSLYDPFDTYYPVFSFGTGDNMKEFISEPVHLKNEWDNTLFIEASNDTNHPDMIFNTPTPFTIKLRIEGMIQKFEPQSTSSSYEDVSRDMEILNGEPYRKWQLQIGAGIGTPDWLIDKLNRILLLNNVTIEGVAYAIDKDAKLELTEVPGSPYAFWTIPIREKNNRPGLDIDATGINQTDLTVMYNIETKAFTSEDNPVVNAQETILQITDVE